MNPEENPKEAFDSAGKTLPVEVCTTCGYEFDCATDTQGEARPGPGDVTLCLKCGEVFQFDSDMKIKDVELSALLDLDPGQHAIISKAQALIRQHRFVK